MIVSNNNENNTLFKKGNIFNNWQLFFNIALYRTIYKNKETFSTNVCHDIPKLSMKSGGMVVKLLSSKGLGFERALGTTIYKRDDCLSALRSTSWDIYPQN